MATEQERKDKVKAEDLQKAVIVALQTVEDEVESMKLYDDIKDKEPQTRMILDLQKGTQKYVAPSYTDITDEKMRNYKKILHQSQWEVQSKLSVIKTYASKPLAMDKIVNLARTAKDMQNIKKPEPKKKEDKPPKAPAPAAAAKEEKKAPPKDDDTDPPLPPKKAGETFSQQVANNFKVDEGWSVNLDDVEIERQIGQGSFGKVYVGTYFGTKVAIKKIVVKDEREMTLIRREVDMLKDVRHPNIVSFYGICKQDDALLLVQEFVSCGELYKLLKDDTVVIDWKLSMSIARDTAAGMAYLHSRGVIHRDLKSENLLVDEHWRIKICDFGLARIPRKSTRPMTHKIGTPFFMAPEVILGKEYDDKADIFSFGVVLLELITRCKGPPDIMERGPTDGYAVNFDRLMAFVPKDVPSDFFKIGKVSVSPNPAERPTFKQIVERIKYIQDYMGFTP